MDRNITMACHEHCSSTTKMCEGSIPQITWSLYRYIVPSCTTYMDPRGYITIYCTPSDLHSFIILRPLIIYSHTVNKKGRRLCDNSKFSGQSLIFHDNYLCTECSHVHTVLILCSYQAELCTELLQLTSRGREVHVGQAHVHSAIWWCIVFSEIVWFHVLQPLLSAFCAVRFRVVCHKTCTFAWCCNHQQIVFSAWKVSSPILFHVLISNDPPANLDAKNAYLFNLCESLLTFCISKNAISFFHMILKVCPTAPI